MPFRAARSGLKMGSWLPADAVAPWFLQAVIESGTGSCALGPSVLPSSTRTRFVTVPAAPAGNHFSVTGYHRQEEAVLEETQDEQEIITRVAALGYRQG